MIENVMNSMGGVEMFGIISICLFFGFFTGMLLWAASLKKSYLKSMCELPLDGEIPRPDPAARNLQNQHE